MKLFEVSQDNWENWLEIIEEIKNKGNKINTIELFVDENDKTVLIKKPTIQIGHDRKSATIRYSTESVAQEDRLILENKDENNPFIYSYVLSFVNPHRLAFHLGMMKSMEIFEPEKIS